MNAKEKKAMIAKRKEQAERVALWIEKVDALKKLEFEDVRRSEEEVKAVETFSEEVTTEGRKLFTDPRDVDFHKRLSDALTHINNARVSHPEKTDLTNALRTTSYLTEAIRRLQYALELAQEKEQRLQREADAEEARIAEEKKQRRLKNRY